MPGCVLQVSGEDFDVDAFLAQSPLKPYSVTRKGERRKYLSGDGREVYEDSYFCMLAGEGAKDCSLPPLDEEVYQFLIKNKSELAVLNATPGVTRILLDFGVSNMGTYTQSFVFSSKLLRLVGELHMEIMLSIYPIDDDLSDVEPEEKLGLWAGFKKWLKAKL